MARIFSRTLALLALGQSSYAFTPIYRTFSSSTALKMTKSVLVPIGDGSEEIETTCITDTLTRCGAKVTVASVMKDQLVCKMSRGIKVNKECGHFVEQLNY